MTTETLTSLRDRLYSVKGEAERYAEIHNVPVTTHDQAVAAEAPRPTHNRQASTKPNKFGGSCVNCSQYIPAGAGLLGGKVNGKWTVKHIDCSIVPAPAPKVEREARENPHTGIYTVESAEGHTTFRVYKQDDDAEFAPGELLLQRLTGHDNTGDYTTVAFVKNGYFNLFKRNRPAAGQPQPQWIKDAYTLFENPEAVLTAKNCVVCNRVLTTPESVLAGIGPTCAAR